ncbi:MAG: Slp family lipoprotein [Chromatiales bacterium]|nr:Slp family lipoprotein [Gammaproteobacteria bacterium]MBW6476491.1 Slp family lipoprotein [Chromatiales bacterium]
MQLRQLVPLLLLLLLSACSSRPEFDTSKVALGLTPQQAISEASQQIGKEVLWGGMILHANNLADGARLEVLAYPLDGSQAPRLNEPPLGRFLLRHDGYLETIDYAPGRRITVHGALLRIEDGVVDQSPYRFPVVQSQQLHLWPRGEPQQPRVHFGIGVVIGR